jgi:hypothetical protein
MFDLIGVEIPSKAGRGSSGSKSSEEVIVL